MITNSSGVVTSLVTPFTAPADADGGLELDLLSFEAFVRSQARAGVRAVAVAGWIGEGPTLSRAERRTLLEVAREASHDRIQVLAHVGTSDTAKSIALALDAEAAGADAVIVVTPAPLQQAERERLPQPRPVDRGQREAPDLPRVRPRTDA